MMPICTLCGISVQQIYEIELYLIFPSIMSFYTQVQVWYISCIDENVLEVEN